jgi:hypothetical protein
MKSEPFGLPESIGPEAETKNEPGELIKIEAVSS